MIRCLLIENYQNQIKNVYKHEPFKKTNYENYPLAGLLTTQITKNESYQFKQKKQFLNKNEPFKKQNHEKDIYKF